MGSRPIRACRMSSGTCVCWLCAPLPPFWHPVDCKRPINACDHIMMVGPATEWQAWQDTCKGDSMALGRQQLSGRHVKGAPAKGTAWLLGVSR